MDNIIRPDATFDFAKLTLAHPSSIQGGAYFTKLLYDGSPLYIQTPKCLTKQSIVKSGKKIYCDFMFDNNSETIINWFEKLESRCQSLLHEKNNAWFQDTLELSDIENAFTSIIRVYKSGKYYLVRANVKSNSATNDHAIKIYNEHEDTVGIDEITDDSIIISILEIQGIKFTTRNFQIDIDCKQIMVIDDEPKFDNCLIKTNKSKIINTVSLHHALSEDCLRLEKCEGVDKSIILDKSSSLHNCTFTPPPEVSDNYIALEKCKGVEDVIDTSILDTQIDKSLDTIPNIQISYDDTTEEEKTDDVKTEDNETNDIVIESEILNDIESFELKEFEMNDKLDDTLETVVLKKSNQVYFDLYKEARNKAKSAKKAAIIAYLEAKNIKKTYMLENMIDDSDSDFDAEIDEVSESELDDL